MRTEGRGNAGLMDNEENQRQVFLVAHSPWKSHKTRFPHFHRPGRGQVENEKHVFHSPARCLYISKPNQKGGLAPGRFAPVSRLILRLENADTQAALSAAAQSQVTLTAAPHEDLGCDHHLQ
jgi:hypothetical protein